MNTKEHTYILEKQTAKDIAAIRKAQYIIDKIELDDGYGYKPPDSPQIAYLKNGSLLPPFRCDIVAKWAQLAHRQQGACGDTDILFGVSESGEVTLRCGQSSVKLYKIDQGSEPPIHPLPIEIYGGGLIKLAINAKEIADKAKLLTSNAARLKKEREAKAKEKAENAAQAEYERCKAVVTPDAVARCVKRVKRLRTLTNWLRNVDKALDKVPSLPQLIANPLFNAFDPQYSKMYGDARLEYLEAVRKRDNFKPRSWRSPGLAKHDENVKRALSRVRETAIRALDHHVRASGFATGGIITWDYRKHDANDVRRCREYIRDHQRRLSEAATKS